MANFRQGGAMKKGYVKYDEQTKEMIRISGNPKLFPELNIPRSTARYWINGEKRKARKTQLQIEEVLKRKIEDLEKKLEEEKAKNLFLTSLFKRLDGVKEIIDRKSNKKVIVDHFLNYKKWLTINRMTALVGISNSKFNNFKLQVIGCERVGYKKCKIVRKNQLSFKEQETIHQLASDESLRHLSVRGLHFYAFRNNIITCGYDSWLKYVKVFGLRQDTFLNKEKKYRRGIRAKRVNEIWHMDITEFRLIDGSKGYLQVVMDNYSRKVLSFKLSTRKDHMLTLKSIKTSMDEVNPKVMMTDGGGENIGLEVRKFLVGRGVTSLIAKKDIYFSNSMVESFFRTLKMRFVDESKRFRMSKLFRQIERSIETFNQMPYGDFAGATPSEIYSNSISIKELKKKFLEQLGNSILERKRENAVCFRRYCLICE